MSATLQPYVDQDRFTGIRRGDEAALESLVRDRYPALVAEARAHLGTEPEAAPRVVEHALLRTWRASARCADASALDAFLHESLHDEAVRERSRIAARHRFEAHHGVVASSGTAAVASPDTAWQHLAAELHRPRPDLAEHAQHVRHDAAEHVARIGRPRPWLMPALIGAVVGGAVFAGLYQINRAGPAVLATRALASPDVRTLTTRAAQEARTTLADGSVATLRPDTRVQVPPGFGDRTLRTVALAGAASFAVPDGGALPLSVRLGDDVEVRTTNGEIAVRRYPGERQAAVAALRGNAEVVADGRVRALKANEAVLAGGGQPVRAATNAERDALLAWTANTFVVQEQPLRAVLPMLTRWYGLDLQARPATLLDRPITMRAPLGSPRAAIAALERAGGLRFGWDARRMILTDAR